MTLGKTFRRTGKFSKEYRRRLVIFIDRIIERANKSIDVIDGLADILEEARQDVFKGEDYLRGYPFVLLKLGHIEFDGKDRRFKLRDDDYPDPSEANVLYVSRRIKTALERNENLRYVRPKSIRSKYVRNQNIATSLATLARRRKLRAWRKGSNVYEIVDRDYFLNRV
ncbi:MAG: hypothetical protein ACE5IO_00175 [Thermoplasmata archaeon]